MTEPLMFIIELAGGPVELLVLAGVFLGVSIAVIGVRALSAPIDATERRLAPSTINRTQGAPVPVPLRQGSEGLESAGFTRLIAPVDSRERQRVQQQLVLAGFRSD